MIRGYLTDYFTGVAWKRLKSVEIFRPNYNQHEFNGVSSLKRMFGEARQEFIARYVYLGEDDQDIFAADGFLTWYDARENHPTRSEHRLYYSINDVMYSAAEDDLVIIGYRPDNSVSVIVVKAGTNFENRLIWLFNIAAAQDNKRFFTDVLEADREIDFVTATILQELGIELLETDPSFLDEMRHLFKDSFPNTSVFSRFARDTAEETDSINQPDETLLSWLTHEEILFRTFEKYLVFDKIKSGFGNVDDFMKFSLSVQNRRKSRAGYALENHLLQIFTDHRLSFSYNKITEQRKKPDFLFPAIEAYHDSSYPTDKLFMLGVKTSCKDRWRQVLSEAQRIQNKHLLTLETGISANQLEEMTTSNLQLVVPSELQKTYHKSERNLVISLAEFINVLHNM